MTQDGDVNLHVSGNKGSFQGKTLKALNCLLLTESCFSIKCIDMLFRICEKKVNLKRQQDTNVGHLEYYCCTS
jgi:hypothetical protein